MKRHRRPPVSSAPSWGGLWSTEAGPELDTTAAALPPDPEGIQRGSKAPSSLHARTPPQPPHQSHAQGTHPPQSTPDSRLSPPRVSRLPPSKWPALSFEMTRDLEGGNALELLTLCSHT